MLQVGNITHWFGDLKVLDQVSFNLNRGQRAGLIGPNGCGKSTLLKIIAGEIAPDQGAVQLSPASLRLGYLPQALDFPPEATVGDVLAAAQGESVSAEVRLALAAERVAAAGNGELADALAAYDRALAEFEALGGGSLHAEADAVLAGLGMAGVGQERPLQSLSGGQKTRLGLARLLLSQPDLLVLDEPTNPLDIPSRESFERAMARFEGTVLAVVHDRYFIERFATTLWIVEEGSVQVVAAG